MCVAKGRKRKKKRLSFGLLLDKVLTFVLGLNAGSVDEQDFDE